MDAPFAVGDQDVLRGWAGQVRVLRASIDEIMIRDGSGVGQPGAGPGPVDTFLFESYGHPEAISHEIVVEVRFRWVEAIEPR